ncbi:MULTISPECIES: hypothetical protein [Cupriavidus]
MIDLASWRWQCLEKTARHPFSRDRIRIFDQTLPDAYRKFIGNLSDDIGKFLFDKKDETSASCPRATLVRQFHRLRSHRRTIAGL